MGDFTSTMRMDALPPLGTLQCQEDESGTPPQAPRRRYALGPLLASVGLHALALYGLVEFRIETPREPSATPVAIHVQLVSPPLPRALEPPPTLPIEPEIALENPSSDSIPPTRPALPPPRVELPQPPEIVVIIDPALLPVPDTAAPTRLSIRQVVEQLRNEEERRTVLQVCTPVQKRNPMLLCADEADSAFNNTQLNGDRYFFAAMLSDGDGLAREARVRRIANGLRESGMSQSDSDRYVEGIDVNAQQRSTSGDARAGAVRDQMFRNDSTYRQMRRVLNP